MKHCYIFDYNTADIYHTKLPDILIVKNDEEDEKIQNELIEVVQGAISKIIEMKNIEGNKIEQDLLQRIDKIEKLSENLDLIKTFIDVLK